MAPTVPPRGRVPPVRATAAAPRPAPRPRPRRAPAARARSQAGQGARPPPPPRRRDSNPTGGARVGGRSRQATRARPRAAPPPAAPGPRGPGPAGRRGAARHRGRAGPGDAHGSAPRGRRGWRGARGRGRVRPAPAAGAPTAGARAGADGLARHDGDRRAKQCRLVQERDRVDVSRTRSPARRTPRCRPPWPRRGADACRPRGPRVRARPGARRRDASGRRVTRQGPQRSVTTTRARGDDSPAHAARTARPARGEIDPAVPARGERIPAHTRMGAPPLPAPAAASPPSAGRASNQGEGRGEQERAHRARPYGRGTRSPASQNFTKSVQSRYSARMSGVEVHR